MQYETCRKKSRFVTELKLLFPGYLFVSANKGSSFVGNKGDDVNMPASGSPNTTGNNSSKVVIGNNVNVSDKQYVGILARVSSCFLFAVFIVFSDD